MVKTGGILPTNNDGKRERKEKLQTGTRYYKLTRLLVPSAGEDIGRI
jgi:hypothetical protein